VVYKAAILATCKSYWENSDKMTTEQVNTLTSLQKLGERIDAAEAEETTTNGIY
jgi:hypothetical protein